MAMGFNNKIIVVIDVGTDDDTGGWHVLFIFSPGAQSDMFTHLHLSFFISLFGW